PYAVVGSLLASPRLAPSAEASSVEVSSGAAVYVQMWAVDLLGLQRATPETAFQPASGVLSRLRARNAPTDLELLRQGGRGADEVARAAQEAAFAAARPGVPAEEVDRAARAVIEEAGYGRSFFHRTGHGIGLEEHEAPYLVEGNRDPLEVGNCFSIEPGIYL